MTTKGLGAVTIMKVIESSGGKNQRRSKEVARIAYLELGRQELGTITQEEDRMKGGRRWESRTRCISNLDP
jgi:hypothetical protein